ARRVHSLDAALPLGAVALVDPSPDPLEQAVASEACDTMVEALAALPPRCAEVMSLTVLELCSITEIAAALDISSGAVGKQRTRGWRKMRQWFDARGGAPV